MDRPTILFLLIVPFLAFANPAMAAQAKSAPKPSVSDKSFLAQVEQEARSEIDLAKLALQKSSEPEVRSYAQSILSAGATVEKNAQKLAPGATPSAAADTAAQKLAKLSGRDFDQEYMRYEAARQQEDLGLLRHEISTTNDANLLDFGIKAEVPIQEAEKQAAGIASKLGGTVSARNTQTH